MSNSSEKPWSDSPNAPQIPYWLHLEEKGDLAGYLISTIFYGIAVALFFRCMNALLNPVTPKRSTVKWVFVAHTTAMFSVVTTLTAINIYFLLVSHIDNREFPGTDEFIPGPLGYEDLVSTRTLNVASNVLFIMNQWLADGLLLYRYSVIYTLNYWAISFPFLMYLASLAMGILYFYWLARPDGFYWTAPVVPQFNVAFWSISLVLNLLLMLLIVIRLGLHHRNVRNVMGGAAGAGGLYKAVITILIESFSLYAVNFLLYTGPWIAGNFAQYIFLPILSQTQVIAPFLIVLRVANRTAVTSEAVASGNIGSIRFRSQRESTDGIVTLPDGGPVGSVSTNGDNSGEFGGGIETGIEEVPL